ncbi:glycoside hydrolase [Cutaneotrichosporon oleaginosum]|uniref:Glycoside hydrolase n=1 Tax=Cutaneotrichosporon oleaginosum TaxID=879819 RepID=A0A0J0XYB0_9TREE|nr:glycoside hydrolase [Cutaneotrichosporon oleaginosum]KLT46030.1 glycoside hydrolase [Cutaneotrichosporon oleaginosum]
MTNFLKVDGAHIVRDGHPLVLKGAALGGWSYPGHEHQVRRELLKVLGEEKYAFFFDKFLEYFFTDADAAFFAALGLNCVRLPVNYRHFEDDMAPGVFKTEGFKHLDRVVDICAKHGIYTVIDLHAAPGAQNVDWHSDGGSNQALFWVHKDFQDRTVAIWEHIARHYRDNAWVAGYNPLNEPTDEEHTRLPAFYARIEAAIRAVDPHHILFLDGNTFGMDFSAFGPPLPNCVYACHDYSNYGFPNPPAAFTGSAEQVAYHERHFARKTEYMRRVGGPVWNGEFGPVYQQPSDGIPEWEEINETRYAVLECQLGIYAKSHTSWSIWLYKDIGFQGMVYVNPDSAYIRLVEPFLKKKRALALDAWGCDDTPVRAIFDPMAEWLRKAAPSIDTRYPPTWRAEKHLFRIVRNCLLSDELCAEYASYFAGKSEAELDEIARSFAFENCVKRERLNQILQADAAREV